MLKTIVPDPVAAERHEIVVQASPQATLAAALAMPATSDPVVATLFRLRGISGGELPLRAFFARLGFARVVETGRAFVGVSARSGLRLAFGVWAEPLAGGTTRLTTETRVQALTPSARRCFRLYWLAIGPFSALIRRRWLAVAKARAERVDAGS